MANHCTFVGEYQYPFSKTSLRISYTDYEMLIELGAYEFER